MADNSHVIYLEEIGGVKPSREADILIGLLLIAVVILGIGGNAAAVVYFWKKRQQSLPSLLYTIIGIIDIITAVVTILVIPSIFSYRKPMLLESFTLCGIMGLVFNNTQRLSMFMVMMISVTRTIAMFRPFYEIKRVNVILACIAFEAFFFLLDVSFLATGSLQIVYYGPGNMCGVIPGGNVSIWRWNIYLIFNLAWLLLGSVVVFISFIMSLKTVSDRQKSSVGQNSSEKKFQNVSITITLFTALFLLCNLPLLVLQTSANVIYFTGANDYLAGNAGYSWYGLVIAHVFLTSFNAGANPCLYLYRMQKFRRWLADWVFHRRFRRASARVGDIGSTVTTNGKAGIKTEVSGMDSSAY
ncbi:hypothetical protein ACHWQZ_G009115 [Mnemiopsis leidyi]